MGIHDYICVAPPRVDLVCIMNWLSLTTHDTSVSLGTKKMQIQLLMTRDMAAHVHLTLGANNDNCELHIHLHLVGGFHPFAKYASQIGSFPQGSG